MNKAILMGRLTRDPDVRYTEGPDPMAVARFTLAVDRRTNKQGESNADFPSCVAFGKKAEFMEKYTKRGTKLVITGRITTGSYTNRDGKKVYTTDVTVEDVEFAESKAAAAGSEGSRAEQAPPYPATDADGFMNIPDGIDEELPFS